MANILTAPLSGNIYFDDGSQDTTIPDLTGSAVALGFDGCAGLTVTSYNTASGDRFTVAGESGSLFSVNDALTGTVFSVNDASGLPIIEVNSDEVTDTVAIGEFGTNALFVSAGNVGVGTNTPTSPLHVCGNIAVTGTVDGRDIASDGSKLDGVATGATSCTGTVTCIATSGGITGGPITGSGTLGINSTCNTKWDQSGCAGINCTGTTTASNTQTFTNKSGNISQWTNNSGYTTCTGDITCVGVGTGLTGGGASGNVSIAVITACDVSWSGAYTTAKALSACPGLNCTGTTTASNTQTFTNKSGNISQWTNNSGYTTCLGDITSVGAGNGLTGGGTSGGVTLNVGAGTAITVAADTVGVTAACNTAWNAKTTCTGTTTPSSTETFTNKSGNISQWTNDSGYTTCTGTGDITAVVAGNGLTGGATSGSATLNVGAGTAITVAADTVGVTTACNTAWNAKTTCTGTVTSVATGSGLTGGTITSSGTLSVDSTVARTNVNETFSCDVTINGDLTVNGDITCLETIVSTTSALSVVNHGSGPAITVNQAGSNDIVDFRDDNSSVFYIENGGFVGLNCTNPVQRLDVNGNINTSGDIRVDNNIVVNTGRCFVGAQVRPTTDIADAYIASAATWNAKTTCLGTVTCVNGGNGLTGAVTGSGSINVGAGTGICVIADAVCIATTCNTTWNSAYTTTKALSGCAGLTCTGDITAVTAGTNLTGGGTSGSVTINMATGGVGAGTYGSTANGTKIDTITVDAYGRVTAVATGATGSTSCTGTVTSVATGTGLTGGTITSSGTLSINSTCNTTWNSAYTTTKALSSCAGLTCVGDITSVGAGNGLTGGGSSGGVTLNVGAGTAITVAADTVGVTSACNTAWNAKTTCTGTVTSVATGSGLTGGTITSSGTLSVDSTVARTNVDETFSCDVTVVGTISAGSTGYVDKLGIGAEPSGDEVLTVDGTNGNLFTITDSVTGTVFAVSDSAGLPILEAYTDACDMITMGEYGSNALVVCDTKVGVGTATPNEALTVVGSVSATCFKKIGGTSSQFLKADGSVDSNSYTTCTGDITSVGAGNGLTGGGSSGGVTLNVGAGTAITVAADTVGVTSACNTAWNAKTTCTGTVTSVATGNGISGGTITGSGTLTVGAGTGLTQTSTGLCVNTTCNTTWNSAYTTTKALSGCAGLTCTGDITAVTAGTNLTGGGTSGSVTINMATGGVGAGTYGNTGNACKIDTITVDAYGRVTAVACGPTGSTSCTGTVTSVATGTGLTGGTITSSGTLSINSTCNTTWNSAYTTTKALSGCAGLTCVGDITSVGAGNGLTGGGSSGGVTLNVGAGTAITVAADTVGVTAACNTAWNAKTTCTGTVTSIATGNGISGGTITGSGTLTVGAGTGLTQTSTGLCVTTACNTAWNSAYTTTKALSGCAGLTCVGDITAVVAGTDLTGGATSGSATLNVTSATASTANRIVKRDGSGDINVRLLRSEYDTTNSSIGYIMTQVDTATNNYVRPSTMAQVRACLNVANGSTSCTGTVTSIATSGGITGGTITGSGTLSIDTACNTKWDQSGCPGINCTGTITNLGGLGVTATAAELNKMDGVTATTAELNYTDGVTSNIQTQLNAKTTCTGTVTSVATGNGISGGTITSSGTLTVGAGTGLTQTSTGLCVSTTCNTTWNSAYTTTKALSSCAGLTCVGDITAVTAGTNLTGGGTSGSVTINMATGGVGSGTYGSTADGTKIDTITVDAYGRVTAVATGATGSTSCTGNLCGCLAQCIYDSNNNFCIGANAGEDLTTGLANTNIGKCAGRCITTGGYNVNIGCRAGERNTTKNFNTNIGFMAGYCGAGCGNVALGERAMCVSTASNSVAIGKCTLRGATGNSNVAIGAQTGQSITSGFSNMLFGAIAGFGVTTGSHNVYIGDSAGRYNASGANNVAIGKCAGRCYASGTKTSGDNNIYIGTDARAGAANSTNEMVFGYAAQGCGSNTIRMGNTSITAAYIQTAWNTCSDARDKTCIADLDKGLCFIGDLQPKSYMWRCSRDSEETRGKCSYGFLAQDILALEDEGIIIDDNNPEHLSMKNDYLIPILVKGMQDQQKIIESLEKRIEALEA